MIFEAGVVLVVVLWTAGSQPCLCIPQLTIVCSKIMLTSSLWSISPAAGSIRLVPGLWKREKLWLYDFQTKVVFLFFLCACPVLQENIGKAVVTTAWVFLGSPCPCSLLLYTLGHQTLCHTALILMTSFPWSVQEQMSLQFRS